MFEINDLLDSYYEEHKTKEQRDKEDKERLIAQFIEEKKKDNIENGKGKQS